jgi:hypothetical protein
MVFGWMLAAVALATDVEQKLVWDVSLDGRPIGERTMTVRWIADGQTPPRRMIDVWTDLDATVYGLEYAVRQHVAVSASRGPAAFHSVVEVADRTTEVQARKAGGSWIVTVGIDGRANTREWPAGAVHLSTADLFDPGSELRLQGRASASVLSADTGDIFAGPVTASGKKELPIGGKTVPVEGYSFSPPEGSAQFWYTAKGYLVSYELSIMGRHVVATLREPPPVSPDEAPVIGSDAGIREIEL